MSDMDVVLERVRRRQRLPAPEVRRLIRERADATQRDVAQGVGVSREAVSRWESGSRTPRGEILERYLALLDRLAGIAG